MEPEIESGSVVLSSVNLFGFRKTEPGDIVVFNSPVTGSLNIKLCTAVYEDSIFVTGTNLPQSTDSRHFGRIPAADIKGWVWKKI